MDNIWNLILLKQDGNKIKSSNKNPTKSGRYLCTCVRRRIDQTFENYLQIMKYDKDRNCWHDCNNKNGISHNILAWTDKVKPCEFTDFNYLVGGYLVEKQ